MNGFPPSYVCIEGGECARDKTIIPAPMNIVMGGQTSAFADQVRRTIPYAIAAATTGLVLWLVKDNYILFHTSAELFSVSVAFGIFFIAWNTRRFSNNGFLVWIGSIYLYVGIIDLLHALAYQGMNILPQAGANTATQLWIVARYLEAGGLAWAFRYVDRPAPDGGIHLLLAPLSLAAIASILVYDVFPDCYIEGRGLTPFKIASEFVVIAVLLVAAIVLTLNRQAFGTRERILLFAMLATKILSELAFTAYGTVFDGANAAGHVLKISAFYLTYLVVIKGALTDPYHSLFRNLQAARNMYEQSEERFRMAIRPAPIAVFSQDASLRYSWAYNSRVMAVPDGIIGMTDAEVFSSTDARLLARIKKQVLATGNGIRREVQLEVKERSIFDLTIEPLRSRTGNIVGIIGTAIDVSELTRARIRAEQANQSKSRFLAAASHDLRQPFQAMRLFHHLLSSRLTSPQQTEVATRMAEAMDAGESLLNALLDISTLEAGKVEPNLANVKVSEIIGRVAREVEPQAAEKGLSLRWVDCRAIVRSDPVLLTRMIRNLATNALRYTERGGILIGCRRLQGSLRIEVWDTGCGIPKDKLDFIFEDFFQIGNLERDRSRGLGLGLSIVIRLADLLNHPVSVRSQEGRGSVFCIEVPVFAWRPIAGGHMSSGIATEVFDR